MGGRGGRFYRLSFKVTLAGGRPYFFLRLRPRQLRSGDGEAFGFRAVARVSRGSLHAGLVHSAPCASAAAANGRMRTSTERSPGGAGSAWCDGSRMSPPSRATFRCSGGSSAGETHDVRNAGLWLVRGRSHRCDQRSEYERASG